MTIVTGTRSRRPRRLLVPALCLALAPALLGACAKQGGPRNIVLSGVKPTSQRIAEAQDIARRAQQSVERGRVDEAITRYQQALGAYDDFPAAWNNLGVLLMEQERYLEAADAFAAAGERAPSDPRPVFNLGLTWERASYVDEALQHYERALSRDPRYLPAIRGAVRAEQSLGVASDASAERLRIGLMIERDEGWRDFFEQQRIRVDAELRRQGLEAALGGG
jgi:tetratricopeptide (TPR) repeat protein